MPTCTPDKIRNPKTGRCVLKQGKIGQEILANRKQQKLRTRGSSLAGGMKRKLGDEPHISETKRSRPEDYKCVRPYNLSRISNRGRGGRLEACSRVGDPHPKFADKRYHKLHDCVKECVQGVEPEDRQLREPLRQRQTPPPPKRKRPRSPSPETQRSPRSPPPRRQRQQDEQQPYRCVKPWDPRDGPTKGACQRHGQPYKGWEHRQWTSRSSCTAECKYQR